MPHSLIFQSIEFLLPNREQSSRLSQANIDACLVYMNSYLALLVMIQVLVNDFSLKSFF